MQGRMHKRIKNITLASSLFFSGNVWSKSWMAMFLTKIMDGYVPKKFMDG
jgi:hypothetical protein